MTTRDLSQAPRYHHGVISSINFPDLYHPCIIDLHDEGRIWISEVSMTIMGAKALSQGMFRDLNEASDEDRRLNKPLNEAGWEVYP